MIPGAASVDALRKCGYVRTTANLCNVALGSGILALPAALAAGGYAWSLAFTTLFLALAIFTLQALQRATVHHNPSALTYQALIRAAFGRRAETALAFLLLLKFYGTGIAYLIIIGDVLQPLVQSSVASDGDTASTSAIPWYATRMALISAFTLVIVLPLCLFRTLRAISMASAIGVAAIAYIAGFVATNAAGTLRSRAVDDNARAMGSGWDLLKPIGVVVFAFGCHVQSPQVFAEVAGDRSLLMHEEPTAVEIIVADTTDSRNDRGGRQGHEKGSAQSSDDGGADGILFEDTNDTQSTDRGYGRGSRWSMRGGLEFDDAGSTAADQRRASADVGPTANESGECDSRWRTSRGQRDGGGRCGSGGGEGGEGGSRLDHVRRGANTGRSHGSDSFEAYSGGGGEGDDQYEGSDTLHCFETERLDVASSLLRWEQEAAMSVGHSLSIATLGDGSAFAAQTKAPFHYDVTASPPAATGTAAASKLLGGTFGADAGGGAYLKQPHQQQQRGRPHPYQQPQQHQQQHQQQQQEGQRQCGEGGVDQPSWFGDMIMTRRLYHSSRLAVMSRAIVTTVLLSFVLQGTVAVLAYFKFGSAVPSNILSVYDSDYVPAAAARVSMALAVAFTYPLVHSTARYSFYSLLCMLVGAIAESSPHKASGDAYEKANDVGRLSSYRNSTFDSNSKSNSSSGSGSGCVYPGNDDDDKDFVGSKDKRAKKSAGGGKVNLPLGISDDHGAIKGEANRIARATATTSFSTPVSSSTTPSTLAADGMCAQGTSSAIGSNSSRIKRLQHWLGRGDGQPPLALHVALTLLYVGITYGIAILIRDVGVVFSLLGSTAGVITNYLIPALLVLQPQGPWRRALRERSGSPEERENGLGDCGSSCSSFNAHGRRSDTHEDDERTHLLPSDPGTARKKQQASASAWFRLWFWDGLWRDICARSKDKGIANKHHRTVADADGGDFGKIDRQHHHPTPSHQHDPAACLGSGWRERGAVVVAAFVLLLSFPLILLGCATPFL